MSTHNLGNSRTSHQNTTCAVSDVLLQQTAKTSVNVPSSAALDVLECAKGANNACRAHVKRARLLAPRQ